MDVKSVKARKLEATKHAAGRRQALSASPSGPVVSRGAPVAVKRQVLSRAVQSGVSTGLQVGSLVRAADRENYGRVVDVILVNGDRQYMVFFRNPDTGAEATVPFHRFMLTVVR